MGVYMYMIHQTNSLVFLGQALTTVCRLSGGGEQVVDSAGGFIGIVATERNTDGRKTSTNRPRRMPILNEGRRCYLVGVNEEKEPKSDDGCWTRQEARLSRAGVIAPPCLFFEPFIIARYSNRLSPSPPIQTRRPTPDKRPRAAHGVCGGPRNLQVAAMAAVVVLRALFGPGAALGGILSYEGPAFATTLRGCARAINLKRVQCRLFQQRQLKATHRSFPHLLSIVVAGERLQRSAH